MNKNHLIFALTVLLLMGSIWGSICDKKKMEARQQLQATLTDLGQAKAQLARTQENVASLTATAREASRLRQDLDAQQATLHTLERDKAALTSQLSDARASLEKQKRLGLAGEAGPSLLQACETQLQTARRQISIMKIDNYRKEQLLTSRPGQPSAATGSEPALAVELGLLREKVQAAQRDNEKLQQQLAALESESQRERGKFLRELESARAQVLGMEQIIEEKNHNLDRLTQEVEQQKVNTDVLLMKISEQQGQVEKLQKDNREIMKDLASKNDELTSLQDKLMQQPVR